MYIGKTYEEDGAGGKILLESADSYAGCADQMATEPYNEMVLNLIFHVDIRTFVDMTNFKPLYLQPKLY
jgi:hypothetical protein